MKCILLTLQQKSIHKISSLKRIPISAAEPVIPIYKFDNELHQNVWNKYMLLFLGIFCECVSLTVFKYVI